MDLRSGISLWPAQNGKIYSYEPLKENITCDILIVGGGIMGALLAYQLSENNEKGLTIALVEKDEIAKGSTSASTALLIYGLDVGLNELIELVGSEKAVRAYKVSLASVKEIKKIIKKIGVDCCYQEKKTLYLSGSSEDVEDLRKEYQTLKKNDFKVDYVEAKELKEKYGIDREAGIIYHEGAEVDPYKLTHELIKKSQKNGVKIYEHTDIAEREVGDRNTCEKGILTTSGFIIKTCDLVFATGYESQNYLGQNLVDLKSSYVIASNPLPLLPSHWLRDYLVWETSRPYLYVRTTPDNRIIVGGEDEEVVDPKARDALLSKKTKTLTEKYGSLIKDLPISVDYAWTGTFGETKDGLGYVGIPKGYKNIYFALGFGGNGITFGVIAANILVDIILGRGVENHDLLSFDRLEN